MGKFIITEEERNYITGLYEQVSGDTTQRMSLNPESINGEFGIDLWIPENLVRVNSEDIAGILESEIGDLAGNYPVEITKKIKSPTTQGYWYVNFDVQAKHKDTMKQSKWLYDFCNKVCQTIIDTYKMRNIQIKVGEPYYVWGKKFESEPTNSPDKCIGVKFKITQ
jgi:hypothetical protein